MAAYLLSNIGALNSLGDPWNNDVVQTPKVCKISYYSGLYQVR